MNQYAKYFLLLIALMFFQACYNKNEEELYMEQNDCDTTGVTYSDFVQPLLNTNCVTCHSGSAANNNVHLDSYQEVKIVADNGKLFSVINGINIQMPPSGKLGICTITKLNYWIDKGSQNN